MSSKADRLGRGSSFASAPRISARRAAIAAATDAPTEGTVKQEFRLDLISYNPDNPRESLRGIQEMADTLESVGQTTAVTLATVEAYLKERPGRARELKPGALWVMVDGHRRMAGAELLEWATLRAIVDDAQVSTDERLLEAAFIANTQRDDMTEIEQAEALRKLVAFHGSQSKTAKRLGISQAVISQRLSLLGLSPELQADLNAGKRTVEQVRGLAKLSPQEQKEKADDRRAAAARKVRVQPAPATAEQATEDRKATGTYYAVIGPSDAPPTAAAVPPQTKGESPQGPTTQAGESGTRGVAPAWQGREPTWAVGKTSPAIAAARELVERFGPDDRRAIVRYLARIEEAERQASGK